MPAKSMIPNSNGHTNGAPKRRKSREELKEQLVEADPLRNYMATRFAYYGEMFVQQLPIWRLWTARMMLTSDPMVNFSLNIRNAALMAAEVICTAPNPRVQKWVQEQWDFLWSHHRPKLVSAKKWGFAPLQMIFKLDKQGLLSIKNVRDFAPEDCRGLEHKGHELCGARVKGVPIYFPQAGWLSFGAEFGSPYGTAVTRRQYPAWYEKWMDHGAKRLLQLRMVKDAYIGDIFWYPPNMSVKLPDGTSVSWKNLMREVGENRLSGGALTLPRLYDNQGKELTGYTPPQSIPGATEIFNWVDHCDDNILKGADIPAEVVQAADTGSGFSGRSIPFLVLLSVCNNELVEIVQQIDTNILRRMAWLNFGGDVEYKLEPRNLVDSFAGDIQGSSMAGSSIGTPAGGPQQVVQVPQGGQQFAEANETHIGYLPDKDKIKAVREALAKGHHVRLSTGLMVKNVKESTPPKKEVAGREESYAKRGVSKVHHKGDFKGTLHHPSGPVHGHTFNIRGVSHIVHAEPTQHSEEPATEKAHEYSCCLFNLPGDLAFEVRQLGEQIPSADLVAQDDPPHSSDSGREANPHITVLFGLHTDDAEEVRKVCQSLPPVAVQIGQCSVFKGNPEDGPDAADVVKLEVHSSRLVDTHNHLRNSLSHTKTHPEYRPHITIAYVKPGLGRHYADRLNTLKGKVAVFDRLIFSDKHRCHYPILLTGSAQFDESRTETDSGARYDKVSHVSYSDKHQFVFKSGGKEVGEIATKPRADGHHEVSNVLVWPEHQHKGHATSFYKHAWEHSKSQGKKLYISNDRTDAAKALHEKFKKHGVLKSDGEIDFSGSQHEETVPSTPFRV